MRRTTPLSELPRIADDRDRLARWHFVLSAALYGGALGAAGFLVSTIAQLADEVFPFLPTHLPIVEALIRSSAGFFMGAFLAGLFTYIVAPRTDASRSLGKWFGAWLVVGFAFGILVPFFSGFFVPLTVVGLDFHRGIIGFGTFLIEAVDSLFEGPHSAFFNATFGIFTGILAGTLLGFVLFFMDVLNGLKNQIIARYAPWLIAGVLSVAVFVFAQFGPISFLQKLG